MKAQPKASHFVDGAWLEDTAGAAIEVIYPATGEVIARLHEATEAVIEAALTSATRAQAAWGNMRPVERARILQRAAALIRERGRALALLETLDTGKPLQETLVADWPSGADALEYFAGLAPAVTGETMPLGRDFVYTRREPLGVCLGIGAWNYPSQIACWKAAPALAMGNAMVFKPSEQTPLGALKLAELLIEAGLPPGLFNVVQGRGAVGARLVGDRRIAKVSLTGSVATGQKVYAQAAAGVFTADLTRAHRVVAALKAGTTWINAYNLTPVEAPFGGMGLSGVGRENSRAAVEHYSQVKSVYVGLGPVDAPY